MFQKLDDDHLLEAYNKAKVLNLEEDFINLLEEELSKRGIEYSK